MVIDCGDRFDIIVLGAGLYGLAFANTYLKLHPNANLVILEARPCLGGVWSSERRYNAFWTQTPLNMACFSDFPIDALSGRIESYYGFFPAKYVTQYLEDFVDSKVYAGKSLRLRIRFDGPVKKVERNRDDGNWIVRLCDGHVLHSSRLIVATGLTSIPNMPSLPGQVNSPIPVIHHKDFGASDILSDAKIQHIAVVGGAKSAADVAYACVKAGKQVSWIIRADGSGPAAFVPAEGVGPYKNSNELLYTRLASNFSPSVWLPRNRLESVVQSTWMGRKAIDWVWEKMDANAAKQADLSGRASEDNGLLNLRPDTSIFWQNDSTGINQHSDFWDVIASNIRVYRQNIVRLDGDTVILTKDTIEPDMLICATGWQPSYFSFIEDSQAHQMGLPTRSPCPEHEKWEMLEKLADTQVCSRFPRLRDHPAHHSFPNTTSPFRLYKHIAPTNPNIDNIIFLGHIAVGNNFRAAEVQAIWATAYLDGHLVLPKQEEMEQEVALGVAWCRRRYLSKGVLGHWLYYDLIPYTDALLREVGLKSHRKKGIEDFWKPCIAIDLESLVAEYGLKRRSG